MKDRKALRPYDAEDDRELFDQNFEVASATECTGLIPSAAKTESELHSYSKIYDVPLSRRKEKGGQGKKENSRG